jgi:hypothetical protein
MPDEWGRFHALTLPEHQAHALARQQPAALVEFPARPLASIARN